MMILDIKTNKKTQRPDVSVGVNVEPVRKKETKIDSREILKHINEKSQFEDYEHNEKTLLTKSGECFATKQNGGFLVCIVTIVRQFILPN